jgi:non-ribosomal peptide synthetase component F
MAMLAAFNVLLCAESGQTDIVIGTPIANRVAVEVEHLIGFFANTLVLRNDLSGTPTFRDLLRRTRDSALAAYAHQDLPFEKIVEALRPVRDPSRNPIFQVNFRVGARSADLTLDGVEIRSHPIDPGISRFDMAVDLVDTLNGLSGRLEYATALFTPATAQRLATTYVAIAHAVVAEPDRPVHRLPAVRALIERQLAQATP